MSTQPEIGAEHGSRPQSADAPELTLAPVALAQLIATVTLALSTVIVATAVSIGLVRTAIAPRADPAPFAITLSPTDCDA